MNITELFEGVPLSISKEYRKLWNSSNNLEIFKRFSTYTQDKNL